MENTEEASGLPMGYFGSRTGAAAAIETSAAAADGYTDQGNTIADRVYAIVSRGGRPDLANPEATKNVRAATLLVVGARDASVVIELNRKTLKKNKIKGQEINSWVWGKSSKGNTAMHVPQGTCNHRCDKGCLSEM
jgi:hypothetical protein